MSDIYEDSWVTLAAANAASDTTGFLTNTTERKPL